MKKPIISQIYVTTITLVLIMVMIGCTSNPSSHKHGQQLAEVDQAIVNSDDYDSKKEIAITQLKAELKTAKTDAQRYELNNMLFRQYEAYVCDSAIHYLNENLKVADSLDDEQKIFETLISKISVLSKAGLFNEAKSMLEALEMPEDEALKAIYYQNAYDLYVFLSENTAGTEYNRHYASKARAYCDSTLKYSPSGSFAHISMHAAKMMNSDLEKAVPIIEEYLQDYEPGSREYSILCADLAFCLGQLNDTEKQSYYLAQSAISDIKGSIKENMALRELAALILDEDVNRSNAYLKKSIEDAQFFSARMRTNQSARLFPLIDRRYSIEQDAHQRNLKILTFVIGVLAILLAVAVIMIIRQNRKLHLRNISLSNAKDIAHRLNEDLKEVNDQMQAANRQLVEANMIKEAYIKQFMIFCSTSINTLEIYRKNLLRKATGHLYDELYADLKSTRVITDSLKEFYQTFDAAFLSIFPNFVIEFNKLLLEPTKVKDNEMLNTELRIYALMRLGINDNQKIADFLRSSIATVYTYRSRVKARAINPDLLEAEVMKIT